MTLNIDYSKQFKKDLKKQKKRGKDLTNFSQVARMLANEKTLPSHHRNHKLNGNYRGHWECHIEPDWLLIYKKSKNSLIFERTGSHSDLFK